jgi:hypothetical protein
VRALAFGIALVTVSASAREVDVPLRLQAELLAKVVAYDGSFTARAGGHALVLIVIRAGDADSERLGERMLAELRVLAAIGGLPHAEELVRYSSAGALGEFIKVRGADVVYLSTALEGELAAIAHALDGISVLSVGVNAAYVPRRAVLGFDVESGKPKLVVNLGQARRQAVAFPPELLTLARVIQ